MLSISFNGAAMTAGKLGARTVTDALFVQEGLPFLRRLETLRVDFKARAWIPIHERNVSLGKSAVCLNREGCVSFNCPTALESSACCSN